MKADVIFVSMIVIELLGGEVYDKNLSPVSSVLKSIKSSSAAAGIYY